MRVPLPGSTFASNAATTPQEDDVEDEYMIDDWERMIPKSVLGVHNCRLLLPRI